MISLKIQTNKGKSMKNKLNINKTINELDFENFENIKPNELINIKIFGNQDVVIAKDIPLLENIHDYHNIIWLKDHKFESEEIVNKLEEAGVDSNTDFLFYKNFYKAIY